MPRLRPKTFNNGDIVRININQYTLGFPESATFQMVDTDTYDPNVIIEAEDGSRWRIDYPLLKLMLVKKKDK